MTLNNFTVKDWHDSPVTDTPLSQAAMEDLEQRIADHVATRVLQGTGAPESAVTAPVGTIYERTDGGVGTTLYIKETGAGNTGWTALTRGGAELAYAEITSNFTTASTSLVNVTGLAITVTVGTRPIQVQFGCYRLFNTGAFASFFEVFEGATLIGVVEVDQSAVNEGAAATYKRRLAPSAGSHTYQAQLATANASGTATLAALATAPAYLEAIER